MDKSQRIRDPIHNLIAFSERSDEDRLLWSLIGTRPVQRLRRIKQLGFSEFVYPGATHSRFSHVLGAMQTARRMVAVFERNSFFDASSEEHRLKRAATLAAALLHDVGHGPYSHVFEELASSLKVEKAHEEYTRELIKHSEIKEILECSGAYKETLSFFQTDKTFTPYSTIISSQMDCDRLDFLSRDRYFCGLKSSYIDLEWLFDSLLIEEVVTDIEDGIEQFSFVVNEKGLRVVEEFVLAYLKMYNDVYFHKTTRSVQHMVSYIMEQALTKFPDHECMRAHPLKEYFLQKEKQTLEHYMALDDSSFLSFIHAIADSELEELSGVAKRYLNRDLFKCIEIAPENGEPRRNFIKKFKLKLDDAKIYYKLDFLRGKSFKQYDVADRRYLENILIKRGGEHVRLHAASEVIKNIPAPTTRFYFKNSEEKARAKSILSTISA